MKDAIRKKYIYVYEYINAIPSVGTGPRTTESAVVKLGIEKKKKKWKTVK